MKRKITAVLLCVVLVFTLSINVSANKVDLPTEKVDKLQNTLIANEITVNVEENNDIAINEPITPIDGGISFTSTGAVPIGHLDTVSSTMIGGWAYQSDIPNTALYVHIYITNNSTGAQKIYTTLANGYRSDLAAAGYGNGYHAFQYNISWLTFIPGTYTIKAYAIGVNSPINPQLTNTKTFNVRNIEGCAEIITSTYIEGWVWKPDAPNEPLDVHAYIYRSNGQVAHIATTIANHLRTDLISAGKGNGYHGYRIYIDFDSLPEENLRVELHYVDNSGYHPAFYSGYYNNLPIHLIGMIDDKGKDFSAWATQEVINYAEDIGASSVVKHTGATQQNLIEYIHNSRFATIFTHGTQYTLEWKANANTEDETKGSLGWMQAGAIEADYFSNTDCLLLLSCSTASEEAGPNNIAEIIQAKGIGAVVAFKDKLTGAFANNKTLTTQYIGFWGKVFLRELSEGLSVESAKIIAFSELVQKQCEIHEINSNELEILIENNPEYVKQHIYCGANSCVVLGNPNLVVKQ